MSERMNGFYERFSMRCAQCNKVTKHDRSYRGALWTCRDPGHVHPPRNEEAKPGAGKTEDADAALVEAYALNPPPRDWDGPAAISDLYERTERLERVVAAMLKT